MSTTLKAKLLDERMYTPKAKTNPKKEEEEEEKVKDNTYLFLTRDPTHTKDDKQTMYKGKTLM